MVKIVWIFIIMIQLGCSSTWVIRRTATGGTIGYKGHSSTESATRDVQKLIHCPNNSFVSDEMRSQNYVYNQINYNPGNQQVQNTQVYGNNGQFLGSLQTTQQSQPSFSSTPAVGTNTWREYTYQCNSTQSYESASMRDLDSIVEESDNKFIAPSCRLSCEERFNRGQLKGQTVFGCILNECQ
jgi:hypothetical protein